MPYSEHKEKHMYRFFEKQLSEGHGPFWAKGTSITLEKTGSMLILEHDVVARPRKQGKPDEPRFEFAGDELSKNMQGRKGIVSFVDKTLKQDAFKQSGSDGRGRMLKYLPESPEQAHREARNTALATHLHSKFVENTPNGAALIIDRMPGVRLFDIVEADQTGCRPLDEMDMMQRQALTMAILRAFKEQVCDRGLIHLDIKPENIIVDLSTNPFTVNFIDFGLSITSDETLEKAVGTLLFASPEVLQSNFRHVSSKTDNFSLAKIIAQVWGSSSLSFGISHQDVLSRITRNHNLDGLFAGIEQQLNEASRIAIRCTLAMALHPYAARRSSIETIIDDFEKLDLRYTHQAAATINLNTSSSFDEESSLVSSFEPTFFAAQSTQEADNKTDIDKSDLRFGCCPIL